MSEDGRPGPATEVFVAHRNLLFTHRNLLFTVAYEMLGSAADAEDVLLSSSWLKRLDGDAAGAGDAHAN